MAAGYTSAAASYSSSPLWQNTGQCIIASCSFPSSLPSSSLFLTSQAKHHQGNFASGSIQGQYKGIGFWWEEPHSLYPEHPDIGRCGSVVWGGDKCFHQWVWRDVPVENKWENGSFAEKEEKMGRVRVVVLVKRQLISWKSKGFKSWLYPRLI